MVLGFTFINDGGYPVGNAQPTLEAVEEVTRFEPEGWFYSIERDDASDVVFLRRVYHKRKVEE